MRNALVLIALLALVPLGAYAAPQVDCYEDTPNYYLCYGSPYAPQATWEWSTNVSVGFLDLGNPNVNPQLAAFECWPLDPTRLPSGYYAQTVVSARVYVHAGPFINVYGQQYYETASDDVTCRSPTPAEVNLPGVLVTPEPPLPPENPDHDFWWFLRVLVGGYRYWDGGLNFNCATYGLCGGEDPYNNQQ